MKKLIIFTLIASFTITAYSQTQKEFSLPDTRVIGGLDMTEFNEVYSFSAGNLVPNPSPLPLQFKDSAVFSSSTTYYKGGQNLVAKYEVIYANLTLGPNIETIKIDQIIGTPKGNELLICLRSKNLEDYLIASGEQIPVYSEGYWYYYPGIFQSSTMKWLSYEPFDYEKYKSMFDHSQEEPGWLRFTWWDLLLTELEEYPEPHESPTERVTHEQMITYKGLSLHLNWQKGFYNYLIKEYTLSEPIYLYLQVQSLDSFKGYFEVYVRDFSLEPPEKIVEDRLKQIMQK